MLCAFVGAGDGGGVTLGARWRPTRAQTCWKSDARAVLARTARSGGVGAFRRAATVRCSVEAAVSRVPTQQTNAGPGAAAPNPRRRYKRRGKKKTLKFPNPLVEKLFTLFAELNGIQLEQKFQGKDTRSLSPILSVLTPTPPKECFDMTSESAQAGLRALKTKHGSGKAVIRGERMTALRDFCIHCESCVRELLYLDALAAYVVALKVLGRFDEDSATRDEREMLGRLSLSALRAELALLPPYNRKLADETHERVVQAARNRGALYNTGALSSLITYAALGGCTWQFVLSLRDQFRKANRGSIAKLKPSTWQALAYCASKEPGDKRNRPLTCEAIIDQMQEFKNKPATPAKVAYLGAIFDPAKPKSCMYKVGNQVRLRRWAWTQKIGVRLLESAGQRQRWFDGIRIVRIMHEEKTNPAGNWQALLTALVTGLAKGTNGVPEAIQCITMLRALHAEYEAQAFVTARRVKTRYDSDDDNFSDDVFYSSADEQTDRDNHMQFDSDSSGKLGADRKVEIGFEKKTGGGHENGTTSEENGLTNAESEVIGSETEVSGSEQDSWSFEGGLTSARNGSVETDSELPGAEHKSASASQAPANVESELISFEAEFSHALAEITKQPLQERQNVKSELIRNPDVKMPPKITGDAVVETVRRAALTGKRVMEAQELLIEVGKLVEEAHDFSDIGKPRKYQPWLHKYYLCGALLDAWTQPGEEVDTERVTRALVRVAETRRDRIAPAFDEACRVYASAAAAARNRAEQTSDVTGSKEDVEERAAVSRMYGKVARAILTEHLEHTKRLANEISVPFAERRPCYHGALRICAESGASDVALAILSEWWAFAEAAASREREAGSDAEDEALARALSAAEPRPAWKPRQKPKEVLPSEEFKAVRFPDGPAYGDVLYAMTRSSTMVSNEQAMMRRATALYMDMKERGVAPTVDVYEALLYGYGLAYDLQSVEHVWEELTAQGVKPKRATWNRLVDACLRHPRGITRACAALDSMREAGHSLDAAYYNALICGLGNADSLKQVVSLFSNMSQHGVQVSEVTLGAVMAACAKSSDMPTIEQAVKLMSVHGLVLNEDIMAYLNSKKRVTTESKPRSRRSGSKSTAAVRANRTDPSVKQQNLKYTLQEAYARFDKLLDGDNGEDASDVTDSGASENEQSDMDRTESDQTDSAGETEESDFDDQYSSSFENSGSDEAERESGAGSSDEDMTESLAGSEHEKVPSSAAGNIVEKKS